MTTVSTYTISALLSRGTRASVYRALRDEDGRRVVLKVPDPQCSRARDLAQLKHEYKLGSSLDTAAVIKPLALATYEGIPALVLEDFGGESLAGLLGAPMPVERFLPLAFRIAGAVADVHQHGVVHKDLKPDNFIVDRLTGEVKITDFGVASQVPRELAPPRTPSCIEGSLPYMSPEQTGRMNRAIDSRSDLYAVGVTFYQMLTGQLPFHAHDPLEWVHCHVARAPQSPSELVPTIPAVLSRIVLKLLAKMAEDRYQTARGLQRDIERCLVEWPARGELADFPLGEDDVSAQLAIMQKLYGRDAETHALLLAFERVASRGTPELVLVSGYPGIGKSSLVRELHRPIVRDHGYFISGKFDQYKRDLPYSIFSQAFGGLLEQILTESEERLAVWKTELQQALGASGDLIVDIIPQVELLVGPQPAAPPLPPVEAQNRFHRVFRRFIGVFARQEHPLVLFLDDLQWLDSGSLKLLEDLVIHPQTRHLLVLGAYRDNEVSPSHPLVLMFHHIRKCGALVDEIVLGPLTAAYLTEYVADALRCPPERAAPLADLVHEKTAGNPFFAIQFLSSLYQEGLLELDRATSQWHWDEAKIRQKGFTDNVVDLMVRKLRRLPAATQQTLELAACVGSTAHLHILAMICRQSDELTERDLWDAVQEGLVLRQVDVYTFLHDRVQQAAYALIADDKKQAIHLRIGRLLLANLSARDLEENLFDVVGQLNHGVELLTDPAEKDELARLNIAAGKKAKASIAYASARNLFTVASHLLPEAAWSARYDLLFPLFMDRAECEYLCGEFERAEALFTLLLGRARTDIDRARVYELRLKLYSVAGKNDEALAMALEALRLFGVTLPDDDDALAAATRAEAEAIAINLAGRSIAGLADGPEATAPEARAVIGLLSNATPAAYVCTRPQVFPLITMKLVNHSLKYGHTPESCMGYSAYGLMLVSLFDDPRAAYEFSEMSIRLNLKLGDISRRGTVLHLHGDHINLWSHHIATDFPALERGFIACLDAGDLVFASYIAFEIVWQAVERGDTLDDVRELSRRFAAFARDSRNEAVHQTIRMEQQFLACLQGLTRGTTDFDDDDFEEGQCLATITGAAFMCGVVFYHTMKLIAAYLFGDIPKALHHAREAKKTLPAAMAMPMEATFYFFHALALARVTPQGEEERQGIARTLEAYERKLAFWAEHCPDNFRTKHALVSAELARLAGDELQAERRYEEASRAARESGFVHWEALAHELAARFHRARGLETIAAAYLRRALSGYDRWGAQAKVRQIEQRDPSLREGPAASPSATFAAQSEQLDLLSVTKASQTISGELVLDRLLRTLLEIVLEQGGADRACLMLCRDKRLVIEAEATLAERGTATSVLGSVPVDSSQCVPISLVHYAQRVKKRVILVNAAVDGGPFAGDEYLARARPRSVLCLPILRQTAVVGLLYLENHILAGAFTHERLGALELLATQAAIALQNALLLAEERAARAAAESAERRAAFLAEAGALMSESLDVHETFARLVQLCARALGSWCVIDLVEGRDIERLTGAHVDPAKKPMFDELVRRFPPRWDSPHPAARVLRTGEPVLITEISDERLRETCEGPEHFRLLRQLGSCSVIAVPLAARGQTLGVLTISSAEPERRYGQTDLELVLEVARRAATAIDNARLFRASQEAVRVRSEFLTVASHELNTPVSSLMLAVQRLRRAAPSGRPIEPELMAKLLELAERQGLRLTKLVGDLLDVSRLEAGRMQLELAEVDLGALACEVVERFEPDLARSRCAVTIRADAGIVGRWDRSRIDRVITNLLSNAIKFGAGKSIEVSVVSEHGRARLAVRDYGLGIAPAECVRIFGRFERAVSARHYGGLGLGLYISRRIVEEHGGSIRCESRLGAGSTFIVELPCEPPAPPEAPARESEE